MQYQLPLKYLKKNSFNFKQLLSLFLNLGLKRFQKKQSNSLGDVDITQLYTMLRHLVYEPGYQWGRGLPKENETKTADDIERIRHYRNLVCHSDASEIVTPDFDFNESVLDLLGVICDNSKFVEKMFKLSYILERN